MQEKCHGRSCGRLTRDQSRDLGVCDKLTSWSSSQPFRHHYCTVNHLVHC